MNDTKSNWRAGDLQFAEGFILFHWSKEMELELYYIYTYVCIYA